MLPLSTRRPCFLNLANEGTYDVGVRLTNNCLVPNYLLGVKHCCGVRCGENCHSAINVMSGTLTADGSVWNDLPAATLVLIARNSNNSKIVIKSYLFNTVMK